MHTRNKPIDLPDIADFERVALPGGSVLFQVLTSQERPLAQVARAGLPWLYRLLWRAERLGLLRPEQGAAFHGSRLTLREVEQGVRESGLEIVAVDRRHGEHRLCDETTVLCRKRLAPPAAK